MLEILARGLVERWRVDYGGEVWVLHEDEKAAIASDIEEVIRAALNQASAVVRSVEDALVLSGDVYTISVSEFAERASRAIEALSEAKPSAA